MMKRYFVGFLALSLSLCVFFSGCAQISVQHATETGSAPGQTVTETAKQREDPAENALTRGQPTESFMNTTDGSVTEQSTEGVVFLHTGEDVDLTAVKLNVYKKINIVVSENFTSYGAEYIGSAYSDEDGKIMYEKPNDPFVIEIDLGTLPSGMGVKKRHFSYDDNTSDEALTVELYRVASAEAYFAGDDLNFIFKNSDNENVLVRYEAESCQAANLRSPSATLEELAVRYCGDIDCTLTYSGNVSVCGVSFSYSTDREYSRVDYAHYVSLLYEAEMITEAEKTDMLEKFYETDYGKAHLMEGGCCLPG